MNKNFIKELKELAKKHNYTIVFHCKDCGSIRNYADDNITDFITIVQPIEEKVKNKKKIIDVF